MLKVRRPDRIASVVAAKHVDDTGRILEPPPVRTATPFDGHRTMMVTHYAPDATRYRYPTTSRRQSPLGCEVFWRPGEVGSAQVDGWPTIPGCCSAVVVGCRSCAPVWGRRSIGWMSRRPREPSGRSLAGWRMRTRRSSYIG